MDGAVAVALLFSQLACFEKASALFVELRGLRIVLDLVIQLRGLLAVAAFFEHRSGLLLLSGPQINPGRLQRRVTLLVGPCGPFQIAHGFVELGGARIVAAFEEMVGGGGVISGVKGDLSVQ